MKLKSKIVDKIFKDLSYLEVYSRQEALEVENILNFYRTQFFANCQKTELNIWFTAIRFQRISDYTTERKNW